MGSEYDYSMPSMLPKTEGPALAEPWVSVDDVAAHLGVRKDSIYRWIESRGLPACKIGKLWKLKLSAVDAWVEDRGAQDPPATSVAASHVTTRSRGAAEQFILIVDDDRLVRESVSDFLQDVGYGVVIAADGAEALKALAEAKRRPDLIILDLKMPNLDGWMFRDQQMNEPSLASIPVIVVTGVSHGKLDGAKVLRKPLKLPVLISAIETILGAATTGAQI